MDLKKFSAEAGAFFNRAVQYTEEKLGQAEKTEYEPHFESLLQRSDKTKEWTEKLVKQMEALLQPNPTVRAEHAIHEKVQAFTPTRDFEVDLLGATMISAGNDFGTTAPYGNALLKCGEVQQKLGDARRQFVESTTKNYIQPLKAFLDGDMKSILKERKVLETKRLDLDAAKSKLKRTKPENKEPVEAELRVVQVEFDRQLEVTKVLLEGIAGAHNRHLRCVHEFTDAEVNYYAQCHQLLRDAQAQLSAVTPVQE